MATRFWGSLGLVVLLAACGPDADGPSGDVLRLPREDRELAPPVALYTLGSADGPAWQSFTHLAHVAFDGEDNLFVLDRGAGKVFVYDARGRFVREIGRPGHGPGELAFPVRLAVTREGAVVVSDLRQGAFVVFDRDGHFRDNLPFAYPQAFGGVEIRPHPSGGFVSENQPFPGIKGEAGKIRLTWHSLEPSAPRLTAAVAWSPEHLASTAVGGKETVFLPRFYWGVLPTGETVVAHTEAYRLDILTPGGKPERTLERPIEPRRVTSRDRQEERRKRLGEMTEQGGVLPTSIRQAALKEVDQLRFAAVMPVIQDLAVDPSGRIWIRRGTGPDGKSGSIDLIAADGKYLGTTHGARLPVAFSPGGLAAFVEEDSLGVQRVTVSRLPEDWRSVPRNGAARSAGPHP